MKPRQHILMALTVMFLAISCNNKDEAEDSTGQVVTTGSSSTDDSLKITTWNKLFWDSPDKAGTSSFNEPVKDNRLARECVNEYIRLYKTSPANIKFTEWIAFTGKGLGDWLASISNGSTTYNTMRIELGVYTIAFCQRQGIPLEKAGKLTVFLWPYNNTTPATNTGTTSSAPSSAATEVLAFNLGELHP